MASTLTRCKTKISTTSAPSISSSRGRWRRTLALLMIPKMPLSLFHHAMVVCLALARLTLSLQRWTALKVILTVSMNFSSATRLRLIKREKWRPRIGYFKLQLIEAIKSCLWSSTWHLVTTTVITRLQHSLLIIAVISQATWSQLTLDISKVTKMFLNLTNASTFWETGSTGSLPWALSEHWTLAQSSSTLTKSWNQTTITLAQYSTSTRTMQHWTKLMEPFGATQCAGGLLARTISIR